MDGDKSDCNISQRSYDTIADWESSPKPLRIVGSVLALLGVIVGIIAIVRTLRGTAPPSTTQV